LFFFNVFQLLKI